MSNPHTNPITKPDDINPGATQPAAVDQTSPVTQRGWRVVDIVVAAVLGVAIGLVFWIWNSIGGALFGTLDAITPGVGGLVVGPWLLGGVLGGLIIRRPGAALLVELVAAIVSAAIGNQWGWSTVVSGLFQGLGAELVFLAFLYRRFTLPVAALAGAAAGAGAWLNEFIFFGNRAKSAVFNLTYLGCLLVSGAVLAGALGWALTRALAASGALNRFAAGREHRARV
ncbi:ECF transporter S component [Aestuariimicrobium sp. T2.26MG-19.2B]|uniref:ECF transporter S component n=1 Tax=Aestuariimicrobium sp. T2.26MG-19.2B TaxID=3040679 RepID=UPI002477946F|nr:ECF transporter S component [Aestuariimicrobium sp. T2.26MG-19.2B]CAI9405160.1 Putative HMP/thiamine permease protein YkoE [Aestuariimicrobium sp. T2.26MG-19.2B]